MRKTFNDRSEKSQGLGQDLLLELKRADGSDLIALDLIARGADVTVADDLGKMALHHAVFFGHENVAAALIDAGAAADAPDNYGTTPLLVAALRARTQSVKLLIASGADVDARTISDSALTMCCRMPAAKTPAAYGDIAAALIEAGAECEKADKDGLTPLMLAACAGQAKIVKALLARGVDTETRSPHGLTAVMFACTSDMGDATQAPFIVGALLSKGAHWDAADHYGHSATTYAAKSSAYMDSPMGNNPTASVYFGICAEMLRDAAQKTPPSPQQKSRAPKPKI